MTATMNEISKSNSKNIIFANKLKGWMRSKNLTSIDLAKMIGVSQNSIHDWTNGQHFPTQSSVRALSNAGFDVPEFMNTSRRKTVKTQPKDKVWNTKSKFAQWMNKNGYSNSSLAKIIGVSGPAVSFWRNGINTPSTDNYAKLHNLGWNKE